MPVRVDPFATPKTEEELEAEGVVMPLYYRKLMKRGYDAFHDNYPFTSCPFHIKSPGYVIWRNGWCNAFREFMRNVRYEGKECKAADKETTVGNSTKDTAGP